MSICFDSIRDTAQDVLTPLAANENYHTAKGVLAVSLFIQVYGGLGIATLIGFLALCHASALRVLHTEPHQAARVTSKQSFPH